MCRICTQAIISGCSIVTNNYFSTFQQNTCIWSAVVISCCIFIYSYLFVYLKSGNIRKSSENVCLTLDSCTDDTELVTFGASSLSWKLIMNIQTSLLQTKQAWCTSKTSWGRDQSVWKTREQNTFSFAVVKKVVRTRCVICNCSLVYLWIFMFYLSLSCHYVYFFVSVFIYHVCYRNSASEDFQNQREGDVRNLSDFNIRLPS